ncbi:MAG: acyl-CoA carboxylase subunit beta [Solirubrobacterales bacterium]|nr:acyl-CoA carboxylase subunit beta [Solirubrobacterales bacterium]MBV9050166.1 acyl-CoA carboxylase subunit beta [Solirubrobacterales bacterium]
MSLALAPRPVASLTALERLEALCDPGSLEVIRSQVISTEMGDKARPGDGVVGGAGLVDERPVFCYAQDPSYAGGSLGAQHAGTIVRVMELADRARAPVVGFISSGGARMQEGVAALGGYGRIFRQIVTLSGRVPQISIVSGVSAGGGAYSPALTDWVVMTEEAAMFLTGPSVVREALGEEVTVSELGGKRVHERNGVCHFVSPSDLDAAYLARELLGYLPTHRDDPPPRADSRPAPSHDPGSLVPEDARRVYDVREVVRALVDDGELLEVSAGWARNIVTALARIDGRVVGVIANQPRHLGGVLDAASSQKGARFVSKCNTFGIPMLVLVDTPGFMPGTSQESAGVIRFGATLVHAFAQATVPRVTVVLRKAFGGAFITMNSKDLGADYVFAWPRAEIGVMGAEPAVGIIHRRELSAAEDPVRERERLAARYADAQLRPQVAASTGYVDELIAPSETRSRVSWALRSLQGTG